MCSKALYNYYKLIIIYFFLLETVVLKSADKAQAALRCMKSGLEGAACRKRCMKTGLLNSKKKKSVWKHPFVCLAVVGQTKIPTSCVIKDDLLRAGLGENIVQFPTTSTADSIIADSLV